MKRHISIFAFLLGAFAATAQAAPTQRVNGGYYAKEKGSNVSWYSIRMSVDDGTGRAGIELVEGQKATFRAFPESGFKVSQWGVQYPTSGTDAQQYAKYKWTDSTSETYVWSGKPADGTGYLAVNFDYIRFDITFDRNGADGGAQTMDPLEGWTIDTPETALPPCTFTRTGYEMVGWSNAVYWAAHQAAIPDGGTVKGEDFWDDAVTNFDGKLIALWKPNTYTVHFDGNGKTSGEMVDQTFTYDEDAKELSANAFLKENYVFAGWATNAVLGDVVYKDEEKVRNLTAEKDGTVNLYARWKQMHEVTFRDSAMFDGKVLKSEKKAVALKPDSAAVVASYEKMENAFLHLVLKTSEGTFENDWMFDSYKNYDLADAKVEAKVEGLRVTLTTDKPAFFVWANAKGIRGEFSDNSFTLLPGRPKTIVYKPKSEGVTSSRFGQSFSVMHLRQTYKGGL